MQYYEVIKELKDVYFEDSYVTSIKSDEACLEFRMELVLKQEHERFRAPKENEKYCHVPALLKFENASAIRWKRVFMKASTDKNGSIDFGNIDSFLFNSNTFRLEGDWGEVEVSGGHLELEQNPI